MNFKRLACDNNTELPRFGQTRACQQAVNKQSGVTLVELMVALVIGLVVSLAVYSVLNVAEGRKRTTTSINDIDKAGAFAAYQLNKAIASSGSGFTAGLNPSTGGKVSSADYSFGCQLNVKRSNATLLPKASSFPVPFDKAPKGLVVAPIVIFDGDATRGDVLMSMAGSGGLSESITGLTSVDTTGINVQTRAGLTAEDRLLLVETGGDGFPKPNANCLFDQVQTGFTQGDGSRFDVPLAGVYHGGGASAYGANAIALNMGKLPQFNLYGVGDNHTLFKYDLLLPSATGNDANPSPFIENVYQMEAIYGITDAGGAVGNFAWQAPVDDYSTANLLTGTAAANSRLQNITMVRVALIMRTNLSEKEEVSDSTITLFEDVAGLTQTISGLDRKYRYRVIETTIPIRNTIMAVGG